MWIGEALKSFGTGGQFAVLLTAAVGLKVAAFHFDKAFSRWKDGGKFWSSDKGNQIGSSTSNRSGGASRRTPRVRGNAGGVGNPNAGMGMMRGGAGIGAAALGIGAGIGIAAVGISQLADSMAKLDATQIEALPKTLWAMAGALGMLVVPLALVGATGKMTWEIFLALGAAALMVGAGIGIAAAGIGYMGKGLGELAEKSKGSADDFVKIAGGIVSIAGAMASFENPLTAFGLLAFSGVMTTIGAAALASTSLTDSMTNMGVAIKGSKDDFIAVQNAIESISKANSTKGGIIGELANLIKQPLTVKFAEDKVQLRNDVTLQINGDDFVNKVINVDLLVQKIKAARLGI